jgi:hypothetical protein
MAKGDYTLDNFYSEPSYKFAPDPMDIPQVGYTIPSGRLGMTTDPRSANQLSAMTQALNSGVVPIEIGVLQPETFDQIPKQHFVEMRRKAKLAESQISMHAPLIDPTGMTQQGWDEAQQISSERQLMDVIDKAAMLDDKRNVPVTIHSSNYAGSTYKFEGEGKDRKKVAEQLVAVNRETGQLMPLKREEKFHPGGEELKRTFSPEYYLKSANKNQWDDEINKVLFHKENADKLISNLPKEAFELAKLALTRGNEKIIQNLGPTEKRLFRGIQIANAHLEDANLALASAFNKAYKYGTDEEKKELKEFSKEYGEAVYGGIDIDKIKGRELTNQEHTKYVEAISNLPNQAEAIQHLAEKLRVEVKPILFERIENFAIEKASNTFANVAMHAYQNYEKKGKATPIISIEHLPAGMAFSQAGDLKALIEKSQKRFETNLIENEHLSSDQAKKISNKLIGATFDVGHININKKHGFTDKDIAAEAAEIAKYVKHVHLTDNFGYSDSHLPIGMGNVPVKEIMEALGEQGSKANKINEVGGWFEHFKTNPFGMILESMGSPMYSSGDGPYWSQRTGFLQNYNAGYGLMLPSVNYETFGAGFSRLPQELGGSAQQSGASRMGGGGW